MKKKKKKKKTNIEPVFLSIKESFSLKVKVLFWKVLELRQGILGGVSMQSTDPERLKPLVHYLESSTM